MLKQNKSGFKRLTDTRKKEIADWVEIILEDLPQKTAYTDCLHILERENIRLFRVNFQENLDGFILFEYQRFWIFLNTAQGREANESRINFTLAHELGHYYLPWHRLKLKRHGLMQQSGGQDTGEMQLLEREADYFASCLLMPVNSIKRDFAENVFSITFIQTIARRYRVSREACLMRYTELGKHPMMMVYSKDGKVSLPAYPKRSKSFPFSRPMLDAEGRLPECCLASKNHCVSITEDYFIAHHTTALVFRLKEEQEVQQTVTECCIPLVEKGLLLSIFYFEEYLEEDEKFEILDLPF